jgi:aryl-alcohol dehydrogenase-like predicted oxidoreductase
MKPLSRICLGSAQFGSAYGVSNRSGPPCEAEVAAVLQQAASAGIGYLDTAANYGGAESLIGRHLPSGHKLRIVTKLPPVPEEKVGRGQARAWIDAIEGSIDRMRVDQVYAVLVHHAVDLAKPGSENLVEALYEARSRGLTQRVGASIYDAAEIALVRSRFRMNVIQLPLNVLDRRLAASGELAKLRVEGVEIHARSIFLQGLLLMDPDSLPGYFASLRGPLAEMHQSWDRRGMSPLAACLAFALRQDVDVVVVGVNRVAELAEIVAAVEGLDMVFSDFGSAPTVDPMYLNPARWPAVAG